MPRIQELVKQISQKHKEARTTWWDLVSRPPTSIELQFSTAELFDNYVNRSQMHRMKIQIQTY